MESETGNDRFVMPMRRDAPRNGRSFGRHRAALASAGSASPLCSGEAGQLLKAYRRGRSGACMQLLPDEISRKHLRRTTIGVRIAVDDKRSMVRSVVLGRAVRRG